MHHHHHPFPKQTQESPLRERISLCRIAVHSALFISPFLPRTRRGGIWWGTARTLSEFPLPHASRHPPIWHHTSQDEKHEKRSLDSQARLRLALARTIVTLAQVRGASFRTVANGCKRRTRRPFAHALSSPAYPFRRTAEPHQAAHRQHNPTCLLDCACVRAVAHGRGNTATAHRCVVSDRRWFYALNS